MTHDELLAKINAAGAYALQADSYGWIALRAVVELHKPTWYTGQDNSKFCDACSSLTWQVVLPCPTIQAIEEELQ